MADATWIVPGGPAVIENTDGADWILPGLVVVGEAEEEAPPEGVAPTSVLYGPLMGPLGGPI